MPRLSSRSVCTAAIIAASAAFSGCATRTTTPVGYAELHYGSTYAYYPHTYYGGRDVWFIDGRWMYQDGGSWRYYTTEPAPLYRYRTTIRQAPPAPRFIPAQPVPAPVPQAAPPPSPAPPPTRVR